MIASSPPAAMAIEARPGVTRLGGLDGLRGLAALGVALHHVFFHFASWPYAPGPLAALTAWLHDWGWTLVDLFFVLSGYVFAHVYLAGGALNSAAGRRDFVIARIARLYPLHLAALLLFAVLESGNPHNTPGAFAAHLLMLQAFVSFPGETFDYASWSLSVEVACYAVFLAAAIGGRQVLLAATVLFIGASALQLAVFGATGAPVGADMLRRGLLGFFMGQALWQGRAWLARVPWPLLVVVAVAGFALRRPDLSPVLPLSLLAWPAVLLLALRSRVLAARPLLWLGDRSYAIYLLNPAVILLVARHVDSATLSLPISAAVQAAMVLGVLAAADLSYRWLERPARRAVRRALPPRDPAPALA